LDINNPAAPKIGCMDNTAEQVTIQIEEVGSENVDDYAII